MKMPNPRIEFSRPILFEKITSKGIEQKISATPDERARLAERFALVELSDFRADLVAQLAEAGQTVRVTGRWSADVVQQCVVTLEALPAHLEQDVDVFFLSSDLASKADVAPSDETYEAIIDGIVDIGELVSQLLGATLNPYPRKPGATFIAPVVDEAEKPVSPFAQLIDLKKPRGS